MLCRLVSSYVALAVWFSYAFLHPLRHAFSVSSLLYSFRRLVLLRETVVHKDKK